MVPVSEGGSTSAPSATDRMVLTKSSIVASFTMNPFAPAWMNAMMSSCAGSRSITMTLLSGTSFLTLSTKRWLSWLPRVASTSTTCGLVSRTWSKPASPPSAAAITVKSGCSFSRAARPSRTSRLSSITNTRILFVTNRPPRLLGMMARITLRCREDKKYRENHEGVSGESPTPPRSALRAAVTVSLLDAAAEGPDVGQRHRRFRQGSANEASTGQCDRCTRENVSFEVRIRLRCGRLRPPDDVARLRATSQVHREAGAGESAGDLERPAPGRRSVERQRARLRLRADTVDAGRQGLGREGARQHGAAARRGRDVVVRVEVVAIRLGRGCVPRVNVAGDRAPGVRERGSTGDAYVTARRGPGTCHRRATQDCKAQHRTS